ncbi:MAG: DUF4340 domain-containing protein [Saprospiraceae bacterium]|nr:DUF4340 domain-containing protein [Saprospiraceae bacterium]
MTLACGGPDDAESVSAFSFKVEDTEAISNITLRHVDGTAVHLSREEDHWTFNEGPKARPNAIRNLLDAISRVELRFIPVLEAQTRMQQDIEQQGVEVIVKGSHGDVLAHYWVGGMTPDERGTFMRRADSNTPVVTGIPGWEGGLRIRYWQPMIDWVDRTVFEVEVAQVQEVHIDYLDAPQESVHLRRNEAGMFDYLDREDNTPTFTVSKSAMDRYLISFQSVGAEAVIDQKDLVGVTSSTPPWCTISIESDEGAYRYSVYPLGVEPTARGSIKRHHFVSENGDVFLVQDALVKEVFLGYNYFFDHRHL